MELSAFDEEQIIKTEPKLIIPSLELDYPPLISIKGELDIFNQTFSSDQVEKLDSMDVKTEPNCNCNTAVYVKDNDVACSNHYESHVDQSGIHLMSGTMSQYLSNYSDNVSCISL